MEPKWVASANPPVFHVLTIGTTGGNGTSATSPVVPGTGNNAVDTAISFGSVGDTRSSVFVDYTGDVAYVGSDDGVMHKFSGVFLGVPAEVSTGGWPLQIISGANHKIAGPVFDSISRNIYHGDDLGIFTYIREVGSTVGVCIGQPAPPCWGQVTFALGSATHPIIESPIVDSTAQRVYAFVGGDNSSGTHAIALQANMTLLSSSSAPVGQSGANLYAGTFDDNYYTSPPTGFLYVCGYTAAPSVANPVLYRLGFAASGKMNTAKDTSSLTLANSATSTPCSPMTELRTASGKDELFFSVQNGCLASGGGTGGCIMSFDITTGFPSASSAARAEAGGTSGIIVDNISAAAQASNIYFTTLSDTTCGDSVSGGGCAVKLTQTGLN
jgi:hypothetical protein